jgi:hypothetical protein
VRTFLVWQLEPCLASLHESAGEEVKRARLELVDIYVELEGNVTTALEHGRSKPNVDKNGFWDHSSLLVDELKAAAQALSTYPLKTPAADVLVEKAMSIVAVREKLFTCSWGQLAHVLKGFSPEVVAIDEIAQAAVELEQMRTATESALREALLVGRSVKVVGTKKIRMGADWFVNVEWDHSGINDGLERLETAAQVRCITVELHCGPSRLKAVRQQSCAAAQSSAPPCGGIALCMAGRA